MKRLMKVKKNIARMKFCLSAGAKVYATDVGETYSIYPMSNEALALSEIPSHYLEEVGLDERGEASPDIF